MPMNHLLKGSVLAGAAVLVVAALSAPSQAQSPRKTPPPPAEEGCYDILPDGTGGMTPHVEIVTEDNVEKDLSEPHAADLQTPSPHKHGAKFTYNTYTKVLTDQVDVSSALLTQAGSTQDCSAVRYRLRLVGENGRLITDVVVAGTVGPDLEFRTFFDVERLATDTDGSRFAFASVTAETASGQVADTTDTAAGPTRITLDTGGGRVYAG